MTLEPRGHSVNENIVSVYKNNGDVSYEICVKKKKNLSV